MKLTNKRLVSILLCLAMVLAMLPMAVFADAPTTLYLKPNSNWKSDGARFAMVLATEGWSAQVWVDMTDADNDGIYEAAVPQDGNAYSIVIFCRMNPGVTANNWDNKWNQTADLSIPTDDTNLLTVNEGQWDCGNNCSWSVYGTPVVVEDVTVYCVADWASANVYYWGSSTGDIEYPGNAMTLVEGTDNVYTATVPSDAAGIKFSSDDAETGDLYVPAAAKPYYNVAVGGWFASETVSYYVAGAAGLVGVEWDPAGVEMTKNENGLYAASFENIAAGYYAFKVTTGAWDTPSYGAATESGNYELTVDTDGSTVNIYFNVETSAILVDVVTPAVEPEVGTLTLGDNTVGLGEYTFTATQDGVLTVDITAMSALNEETGTMDPVGLMMAGRFVTLLVNGITNWTVTNTAEVKAGDVVTVSLNSTMFSKVEATMNLSIAVPGADQIKWQITAGTNAESESTSLRFVSYVDSLDYSKVIFNVTYGGETETIECKTAYSAIIAAGVEINDVTSVFGEDAAYFITASMDVPAEAFDGEISVTVTRVALDGTETTSEARSIVVSDAFV